MQKKWIIPFMAFGLQTASAELGLSCLDTRGPNPFDFSRSLPPFGSAPLPMVMKAPMISARGRPHCSGILAIGWQGGISVCIWQCSRLSLLLRQGQKRIAPRLSLKTA